MNRTSCPICGKELKSGCCLSCGYDKSEDVLISRTLRPAGGMDVLRRWTFYAAAEVQRGKWTPRVDSETMDRQISALSAADGRPGFLLDESGRRLLRFLGSQTNPIVPKCVEEIAENAFQNAGIESVMLPDGLRVIGKNAFAGAKLRSLVLPYGLQTLENQAFRNSGLEYIKIPGSVKEIGVAAFLGCTKLRTVIIEPGVARICDAAFSSCRELETVSIPDSVLELGNYVFYHCLHPRINASLKWQRANPSLKELFAETPPEQEERDEDFVFANAGRVIRQYTGTKLIPVVPEGTVAIGKHAFANRNVESVKLPKTLKSIQNGAFRDSCIDKIELPEGLKEIQDFAFLNTLLTSVEIPGSVEKIGDGAFYGCGALKSVRICHGVKKIGADAFSKCVALKTIEIPDSVTEVGEYAFYSDQKLRIEASDSWKALHSNLAKLFYR